MKKIIKNVIVNNDLESLLTSPYVDWKEFDNKTFYITGATGTIGSFIIGTLRHIKKHLKLNIKIIASVRNKKIAQKMYKNQLKDKTFKLHVIDINEKISYKDSIDYIIHTACATNSKAFVEQPASVFKTITKGTENVLEFAKDKNIKCLLFLSSMEVYGDIDDDKKILKEEDLGYINPQEARSSYPMGKRAAEAICLQYANEYNLPIKIARLAQVIGANTEFNDPRVYAHFARSVVKKQDIILNTTAQTIRSYCYITDVVAGLFAILSRGKNKEIYNIANEESAIKIKDMAQMLCDKHPEICVKIELTNPDKFYKETYWNLDTTKIKSLNWKPQVSLKDSYSRLISSFLHQKNRVNTVKKKTFLQQIFSAKNNGRKKIITICGLEIKLDKGSLNRALCEKLPIQKNKIVINSSGGRRYGCNAKYVVEEILKRKLPYEIVWMCKDEKIVRNDGLPKQIKTTGYKNNKCIKDLYTAALVISNVHCLPLISAGWIKSDKQKFMQLWHGSLGIKKIDLSVKNDNSVFFTQGWHDLVKIDIEKTDYLISNSEFEDNVFKDGFLWEKDIYRLGHPRNDVFFYSKEKQEEIRNKVCEKYNIDKNKKIVLYAPSFRDDKRIDIYNIDFEKLTTQLKEKFGGDWVVLTRLHSNLTSISKQPKLFKFSDEIINASFYPDMQELLVASDVGITDYSSWIFDFMLSKKPAFIYAEDIDKYNTDRGFYYPLESTPFPIAQNNDELCANVSNIEITKYEQEIDKFLKEKGCMEDGQASKRVVDLIETIMNK